MAIAQRQRGPQQTYMATQGMGRGGPSGLADVLEVLLDKGLVIDAFVRVSLVGIELLTVDARIVVASVDTYLRFAEAVNRLDLLQANNSQTLGEVLGGGSSNGRERSKSRALSSPGREREDSDHDGSSGDADRQHVESDDEGDKPAEGAKARTDDGSGDEDDQGLLARIKERGQVF
jgi:gas vesicle structural protein